MLASVHGELRARLFDMPPAVELVCHWLPARLSDGYALPRMELRAVSEGTHGTLGFQEPTAITERDDPMLFAESTAVKVTL